MKVIAINGSPRKEGNTAFALETVGEELRKQGIEFEVVQIGNLPIRGCIACGGCSRNKDERCVMTDDGVNDVVQKMKQADGILLGAPVYYSGIPGTMKSFLDRAFYISSANGGLFRHKAGAAVTAVRRSGGVVTFDSLNHYLLYSEMVMPTSSYWNVTHGRLPKEAEQDGEGTQVMRVLGRNMAWLMQVLEAGKAQIAAPAKEDKIVTNFIR